MQTLRRKQNSQKQNITYIALIVILVIFFATVGLRLVINTSLFIAGFSNKESSKQTSDEDKILIAPEITNLPDATNSAQITISGIAQRSSSVKIFANNEEQKEVNVTDDEFNTEIQLNKGENSLYVLASYSQSKRTKKSPNYTVFYLHEKPKLEISEPQNESTVNTADITIKGLTNKDIIVKVQNVPAVIDQEGNFSSPIRLKEGENIIKITAEDKAGNNESIELKIIFSRD